MTSLGLAHAAEHERPRVTVIACGAIGREIAAALRLNGLVDARVVGMPAMLHNEPEKIPQAVAAAIDAERIRDPEAQIVVGYADCGTGGRLAAVCAAEGIEMLPGPHCYELLAGKQAFTQMHEDELGTFFLTDYLVRNFDRLVMGTLGLDRHPELAATYFAHYRRVVHLAQFDDPAVESRAREAATTLGLAYERRVTGLEPLQAILRALPVVQGAAA